MKLRSLLFCGYCAVVTLVPTNPHPYTFFIGTITWFINSFCHHYFRAFLSSGIPASKTIFHSLLWSLTICYQLHSSVMVVYALLGNFAFVEKLVTSHPAVACVIFTPRWTSNSMILYLFYLATLKLIIAVKPYSLMHLNQEKAALHLNILAIMLCLVDTGVALLFQGSTCDAMSASLFLKITTGLEFKEKTLDSSSSPTYVLAILIIILITVVEYAVAEIIANFSSYKMWFSRCRERISNHTLNNFDDDMHISRASSGVPVLPPNNYGQPQPQLLTQFQKIMNLIKGMGFFAGFVCLISCILLIFFEFSFIIQLVITTAGRLLIQCTPLYWVLVVDDVYELTKRRTAHVLSSVYHYFTDGNVSLQIKGRVIQHNRDDETPRDVIPIPESSITLPQVADQSPRDILPIPGSSTSLTKVGDQRTRHILPIPGSSTSLPKVGDQSQRHILPIPGSSTTLPQVADQSPRRILPIPGSSTTLPKVGDQSRRDILSNPGSSTNASREPRGRPRNENHLVVCSTTAPMVADEDQIRPITRFSTTDPMVADEDQIRPFPLQDSLPQIQE